MSNTRHTSRIRHAAGKKGFTLIEALVAISILTMSTALPLTASYIGASHARDARDQLVATYLAQDAIEYLRHRISENVRKDAEPLRGLDACAGQWCLIDALAGEVAADPEGEYIGRDPVSGLYGYDDEWEKTQFVRRVMIEAGDALDGTGFELIVEMEWGREAARKSFPLREYMTTWVQYL